MIQEPQTQLNDLPEEILLQIFENINFKSLLELSLVCKRWHEIIGQDAAIMKKISLSVYSSPENIQMYPNKFARNYQSVKIYGRYEKLDYLLLMALMNGSNLRNLEINRCVVMKEDEENFSKQLASLTKLESLRISQLSPIDLDLTHLNQLKELLLDRIDIVKFPKRAQLTSLYIRSIKNHESSGLISFLANQKKLEELSFHFCEDFFENNPLEKLQAAQFPLKKLSMRFYVKIFGTEENFLLFMKKFVNSLEEIYIKYGFPTSVYEMIFNEFHKLKTLRVDICRTLREDSFFSNFSVNPSIQKLIINDDLETIKEFFNKLPNLETLDLGERYLSKKIVMFIAGNPSKLKNIHVSRITGGIFDGVNIPWLKKLSITALNYNKQKHWIKVVKAMQTSKNLKF